MAALTDEGKFLLAARKYKRPTCTDYIISLNGDDMSKGSSNYVGKLRYIIQYAWFFPLRAHVLTHFPIFLSEGQTFWEQSSPSLMGSQLMWEPSLLKVDPLG